jgi:hypothetical protein
MTRAMERSEKPLSQPQTPGTDREPEGELWIDRWILPAVRDLAMLPVLLVMIGHVVAFTAPAILFAVRDRSFGAQLALSGLLVLTFGCVRFELRRHGRPDVLSWILLVTWMASAAAAWACGHYGLL